jgi:hypothetical protein
MSDNLHQFRRIDSAFHDGIEGVPQGMPDENSLAPDIVSDPDGCQRQIEPGLEIFFLDGLSAGFASEHEVLGIRVSSALREFIKFIGDARWCRNDPF